MTCWLCAFSAILLAIASGGCGTGQAVQTGPAAAPKAVVVSIATVTSRHVQADFQETGTFMADESSDVAPPVAGQVVSTPVNAGDRVRQGQVICELDHRDAQLKLDQAKAQLQQATASLRQAQTRIGWSAGAFDPTKVPEVAAARANYESAQAQAKMAAADSQRYANLVTSGDVSKSAYEKAHTQQETAVALSRKPPKPKPTRRDNSTKRLPIRRGRATRSSRHRRLLLTPSNRNSRKLRRA
jgi:multidrug resistance efflux pump